MLQAGRKGGGLKVDECLLVQESTQNNGGAPSLMGERPHSERAPKNNGGAPSLMGARPHSERAPKNNGGAHSSRGRFGDSLLFFIAAKS
jgi:hypothetical protein